MFFLLCMAALNSFIFFKKCTTNQNQKGKGCAFKDVILHCVEKITEPQEREKTIKTAQTAASEGSR